MVAGDELAPVETVVSAAVRLAETDHHEAVVVGEHVLLGAHAHRVPTLHTPVGVHHKNTQFIKQIKYTVLYDYSTRTTIYFKFFLTYSSVADPDPVLFLPLDRGFGMERNPDLDPG